MQDKPEYVIASIKALTVWNFYPTHEAAERALPFVKGKYSEDAEACRNNHVKYGYSDNDPDYWLKQAEAYETKAADSAVMTWDEYEAAKAEKLLSLPIFEITAEEYDEVLNVLPPMKYGVNRGIPSFFMSEFTSGSYTNQYAHIGDRYFGKLVNFHRPETWITREMVKAIG